MIGHVLALDRSLEGTLPFLLALLGAEDSNSHLRSTLSYLENFCELIGL